MKKIKLGLTTLALLSLGSFADAGCLRCEDGHVICHGTCDDPIQGRAKEILGKRFCLAQDSSSHLTGWGFDLSGRAYSIDSFAGMPDPSKSMSVSFLESSYNRFEIWQHNTATGSSS